MTLELVDLRHRYGEREVLAGLDLTLQTGEIGCLLGPSGCGKTTALRCIAGFEDLSRGEIRVDGETLSRAGFTRPPEHRNIGMVFQSAALLPHLTALGNVAFGLHALPGAERNTRARALLDAVGLAAESGHYPHELSGGEQQRVALARALAPSPRLVLLDEPFANLDAGLRERLGTDVRRILKEREVTALLVTHDQLEAFTLADHIGVMRDGRIAQWGTPHQIYHQPVDRHVADFVGRGVLLPVRVLDHERIVVAGQQLCVRLPAGLAPGSEADLLLRPDDVVEDEAGMDATVVQRSFLGPTVIYAVRLPCGQVLQTSLPAHREYAEDAPIRVSIRPAHIVLFPR